MESQCLVPAAAIVDTLAAAAWLSLAIAACMIVCVLLLKIVHDWRRDCGEDRS